MPRGGDDAGGHQKPFAAVRFKLFGFSPAVEKKYTTALERGGGSPSMFLGLGSGCTHLIVSTYNVAQDNDWCSKGIKGGAAVVNDIWLNHCLKKGQVVPVGKAIYRPFMKEGVPGCSNVHICCSGYQCQELDEIKRLIYLMGAHFHEKWSPKISHAICAMFEGDTYNKAIESGAMVVNNNWLYDSLNARTILPCEKYHAPGHEAERLDGSFEGENLSENIPTPICGISKWSKTPEGRSISVKEERLVKSTGNKKLCIKTEVIRKSKSSRSRSLQFKSEKRTSLDNYVKPKDRVVFINVPLEATTRELTAPVLKRLLLKSYLPVARLHAEKLSLAGKFGCENFIISDPHETVELCDVETETLTPCGLKADKKAFTKMVRDLFERVPRDVRVWLYDIEEDCWEDALLMNHILMTDSEATHGNFITLYHSMLRLKKYGGAKYKDFLELQTMEYYNNWYNIGFYWVKLDENKDFKDPREAELDRLAPERLKKKKEEDPSRHTVFGLLKTIRDTWAHPARVLQKYFLAIVVGEYERLLPEVQKALYDFGYYGQDLTLKDFP